MLVVDGTSDLALAVAECTRLKGFGAPIVLVSHEEPSRSALHRAGIDSVVPSGVSLSDLEDVLSSPVRGPRRDSSVMLASSATVALNELVVIDRARRLLLVDGREQVLSAQKFELLCYLVEKAGVAVGAQELVKCGLLRPSQASRFKGVVQELRARLGPARTLISAVPGYGYRFDFETERLPVAPRRA
jgi:DNA-binding response OmpR family regulator